MPFQRRSLYLLLAGAAVFGLSVVCGYGSAAPAPSAPEATEAAAPAALPTQAAIEPTAAAALPTEKPGAPAQPEAPEPAPLIPETRRLTLEFPPRMRVGDSDLVRLTLEVDTLGNMTPTAEFQGHTVTGQEVQIPNVYETHNVIAEAELDLAGMEVRPAEQISQPLLPGESVTFRWSVRAASAGTYRGTAWLFLRFVDRATKEESRKALSAQTVEVQAGDLLGLPGGMARAVGGVGSVVGAVLGLPFADDVLKWLWRRIRREA